MTINSFVVTLHNFHLSPGDNVDGEVKFNLSAETNVKELIIKLRGKGKVQWSEGSGEDRKTYSSSESYLRNYITVINKKTKLNPGSHRYPFSFKLPFNLPNSFNSSTGDIKYYVKAIIDREWKFKQKARTSFEVNAIRDLNKDSSAFQEGYGRNHKKLCCLFCKSGPITAVISTPRKGFIPGQDIFINAEVENLSNRSMKSSSVKLIKTVKYFAEGETETTHTTIAKIKRGPISKGSSEHYENVTLKVPYGVEPSNLGDGGLCSIIDVQYWLHLGVKPSGPSLSLDVHVPLIIGTIPITERKF